MNCKHCKHPIQKSTNGNWYHKLGNLMSKDCLVLTNCDCEDPEPKGEKK